MRPRRQPTTPEELPMVSLVLVIFLFFLIAAVLMSGSLMGRGF